MSIFSSIEFYVIAVIVAAVIVGVCARPRHDGPVRQYLLPSVLSMDVDDCEASVEFVCLDDGTVTLTRHGISDLTESGAVSYAINVKGFDVEIIERITRSSTPAWGVNTSTVNLDFLASERYHIYYHNPDTGIIATASLNNRPGIHITKKLI